MDNLSICNNINLPIGSIDAYIKRANNMPILTIEQEQELGIRLYEDNDLDAAKQLVMTHLRYVIRIAQSYYGYGLNVADLIQEGNIGLMKAVRKFNPHKGVRLVSFAVHWIKAEIHEFIIKNWKIVKIATTKAQRKLFFNLRSMKKKLSWFTAAETIAVAKDLGVSPAEVSHMENRLTSIDSTFEQDDTDDEFAPAQYLSDQNNPLLLLEDAESSAVDTSKLTAAMQKLDSRSIDIIQQRWLQPQKATLTELAEQYNVSAERVRQLENKALQLLRASFT